MRFVILLSCLGALALAACQTVPPDSPAPVNSASGASAASGKPRALSFEQARKVLSGKTFSPSNEAMTGENDRFRRAITYVRADTNRAYRYYPNWTKTGLDYSAMGRLTKEKVQGSRTFAGQSFSGLDYVCLTDELSGNSKDCATLFELDGQYYWGPDMSARLVFSEGYDALLGPLVSRAVADDNNRLLWALAGDFGLEQPDLVAKYERADARVWAMNADAQRKHEAAMRAEDQRMAEQRAARAAKEEQRRQAACQRETGKPCPGGDGGLLGLAIVKGVEIWQQAAEDVRNGNVYVPPAADGSGNDVGAAAAAPSAASAEGGSSRSCGQIGCGGLKRVVDNGPINGNPSYRIDCQSDSAIVVNKPGQWTSGTGATYAEQYWGLSPEAFGQAMCN